MLGSTSHRSHWSLSQEDVPAREGQACHILEQRGVTVDRCRVWPVGKVWQAHRRWPVNIAPLGLVRALGNEREVDSESSVVMVAQDKTLDKEQRWGAGSASSQCPWLQGQSCRGSGQASLRTVPCGLEYGSSPGPLGDRVSKRM